MKYDHKIEVHSGPDEKGRYEYTLSWTDPATGQRKSQVFHAPISHCGDDSCMECTTRHVCDVYQGSIGGKP